MKMNKEELRALYKQIRRRMSRGEVDAKSRIITRRLINEIEWPKFKNICAYQPVLDLNEVNISGLVSRLQRQPGVNLAIVEPRKEAFTPKTKFDLIIVPCLAFDDNNHRLGWGGGWYDKFLDGQSAAYKIGVCFQNGRAANIPPEPHDIALDKIMTEV